MNQTNCKLLDHIESLVRNLEPFQVIRIERHPTVPEIKVTVYNAEPGKAVHFIV